MTIMTYNDNEGRVVCVKMRRDSCVEKNDILVSNVMMNDKNDERMNVNSFMCSYIFMSPRSIKFRPLGLAPRDVNAP
jgi:hypothetical protein